MQARRVARISITAVLAVLLLVTAVLGGVGWYYSGQLLEPANARPGFPDTSLGTKDKNVVLAESRITVLPGTWGLVWTGGTAKVGDVVARKDGQVQRTLLEGAPPPDGTKVRMETSVWTGDPLSALGLSYTEVQVETELGTAPAWLVPAASKTWVIAVHGRAGSRAESLRVIPQLHEFGLPVLSVTYRNDAGAPASPDGLFHLGDTEWRDVEAAIKYAQAEGAERVLLYGWSMGGAIVGQVLARSPLAASVSGVVLDAPVTSWSKTLDLQAENRGMPSLLTPVAETVSGWRADIDFSRFDLVEQPPATKPTTLLFHGTADGTVPVQASRDLAAASSRLGWPLQYVEIPGAEHTAGWNVAPDTYRDNLADFLTRAVGVRS